MKLDVEKIPDLSFPEEEQQLLKSTYKNADVILEYGAGGSTFLAANLGKKVFSVESDHDWAGSLNIKLSEMGFSNNSRVYYVDIGETGAWGRPINDMAWRNYYSYPISIWLEKFFQSPDVILIDGRLRPACLVASLLLIDKPTTVLFDDYANRASYHVVESLIQPRKFAGRMALFELKPNSAPKWAAALLAELCMKMSFTSIREAEVDPYENDVSKIISLVNRTRN